MDDNQDLMFYSAVEFGDLSHVPSISEVTHPEDCGRQALDLTDAQTASDTTPSHPLHHQLVMAVTQSSGLPHQVDRQSVDLQQGQSSDALAALQQAGHLKSFPVHQQMTGVEYFLGNTQAGSVDQATLEDCWRNSAQHNVSFATSTSSGQTLLPGASHMTLPGSLAMGSSNFNLHPGMQYFQMPSLPDVGMMSSMPLQPGMLNASSTFKPRLRWTDDLHDKFIDAVEKLGGYSRATPSAILKAMGVDKLELGHVKSHLQKYRTEKKRNKEKEEVQEGKKPSHKKLKGEGDSSGPEHVANPSDAQLPDGESADIASNRDQPDETSGLEAALKKQYELQQMLADQLEAQKKLQSSLEQHTKYISCLMRNKPGDNSRGMRTETESGGDLSSK
mmetsp:Transcript_29275/g.82597  ORF Transcript_29275/g.82597 Transcript_29275/m.82597 type:complete len:389 (+) Transcript_29275:330-1496(+)|eukprot:CAMPEP_0117664650 /NCGR_PEP_ID=MMETSP0804-20121206/9346_1 /TAXON_ID=1074897 /ORGANISM="Tetraselmis astigmatica, Strain CCMP880" /LENGTH=388 /DNA_ID=CAMNT_0005471923 /DNA_START=255 /DNA_END=1421 /DNA_ORIENTATION=-